MNAASNRPRGDIPQIRRQPGAERRPLVGAVWIDAALAAGLVLLGLSVASVAAAYWPHLSLAQLAFGVAAASCAVFVAVHRGLAWLASQSSWLALVGGLVAQTAAALIVVVAALAPSVEWCLAELAAALVLYSAGFGLVRISWALLLPSLVAPTALPAAVGGAAAVRSVAVVGAILAARQLIPTRAAHDPSLSWGVVGVLAAMTFSCWLAVFILPHSHAGEDATADGAARRTKPFRRGVGSRILWRVIGGLTVLVLWMGMTGLTIEPLADEYGLWTSWAVGALVVIVILAFGLGSAAGGWLAGGRIEWGWIGWGAAGSALGLLVLLAVTQATGASAFDPMPLWWGLASGLALVGAGAGVAYVALVSYLIHHSPSARRATVVATGIAAAALALVVATGGSAAARSGIALPQLAGLPADLRGEDLTAAQAAQVHTARLEFQESLAHWRASSIGPAPTVREHLAAFVAQDFGTTDVDEGTVTQMRDAALAQLLWCDLHEQRAGGEPVDEQTIFAQWPDDRRIVQAALVHSAPRPALTARQLLLLVAILAAGLAAYTTWRFPQSMVQVIGYWILRLVYRVRVTGLENLPTEGGAVLVGNHVTYFDGVLWLFLIPRRLRMIAWAGNFNNPLMVTLARFAKVILISGGPKSIQQGLAEARKSLGRGELVGMFPEGGITRTGQVQAFRPGLMRVLDQLPVPVVPVYLDQMWGSIFSFAQGRAIWKMPRTLRRPVTLHIGRPLWRPADIHQVRSAVIELGADAARNRQGPFVTATQRFLRNAKRRRFRFKLGDSMGGRLSGGQTLARTLVLRRLLRRHVLDDDERTVALLIPPSVGAAVCNLALAIDRRITINLNYTASSQTLNDCLRQAGVRRVITSRKAMEKFDLQLEPPLVYLEDLREKVTRRDRIVGAASSYIVPGWWLERYWKLRGRQPNDWFTIIFTSGSTGRPKGVVLTELNIASNIDAIQQVVNLNKHDVLAGILPFFHSFGYTVTLWGGMALDLAAAFHVSPLDARQVGKLCQTFRTTCLLATPTFLRTYLRRCTKEEFATLSVVVAGAEKLPVELCNAFESTFGVRPVEGYGTTELSPLVSVNVPPTRSLANFQIDCKEGTVGRPIPNVVARITDLDSGQVLTANQEGMLWIKGPNVMHGYLDQPELTREVIVDGWYKTGDVGLIDADGFIKITGRMSRFSKIGGEMVPHVRIEECLAAQLGGDEQDETRIAVTAVVDPKRGERLVVLHTQLSKTPDELCRGLAQAGLPNLFIPAPNAFYQVDQLPLLGTGKLDLRALKALAEEKAAE
jgi:1-acyl-sn-glycerol-3-phosphate acyltransferase